MIEWDYSCIFRISKLCSKKKVCKYDYGTDTIPCLGPIEADLIDLCERVVPRDSDLKH